MFADSVFITDNQIRTCISVASTNRPISESGCEVLLGMTGLIVIILLVNPLQTNSAELGIAQNLSPAAPSTSDI